MNHLRRRRCDLLQMEEGNRCGSGRSSFHALGGSTDSAGRTQQEEDKDPISDQTYDAALRSGRTAGVSPTRKHGERAEQGDLIREWQKQGRKGSVSVVPNGNTELSTLTQRLLKRWSDRKRGVSELL